MKKLLVTLLLAFGLSVGVPIVTPELAQHASAGYITYTYQYYNGQWYYYVWYVDWPAPPTLMGGPYLYGSTDY